MDTGNCTTARRAVDPDGCRGGIHSTIGDLTVADAWEWSKISPREKEDMGNSFTTLTDSITPVDSEHSSKMRATLVVAASPSEPDRIGEILVIPEGILASFGRGEDAKGGGARAVLARQRPGVHQVQPPLASRRISRQQLLLMARAPGVIEVENIGKPALSHNGRRVSRAEVQAGDVLQVGSSLVLVCVMRPPRLPSLAPTTRLRIHPFGAPDASGQVGESPAAWSLRERVAFLARRDGHVLVLGRSGTGKELAAQGIHRLSDRSDRKMIARNAATFPETLIDAELFGNIKDFPNPGMADRPGLIGEASASTLFLDEIGELSSKLQAHLLRVMDAGEYQRLGESKTRRADLRLVVATNRPVAELKHDLAARLSLRVTLPGLLERQEDIPLIARHLLRKIADQDADVADHFFEENEPRIAPEFLSQLLLHRYTTHVRELEAMLWSSIGSSRGTHLAPIPLPSNAPAAPQPESPSAQDPALLSAEEIQRVLDEHDGVQDKVWRALGLSSRHVLGRLIKKHGLEVRRAPDAETDLEPDSEVPDADV